MIFRCAKKEQKVFVGDVNDNSPVMSSDRIELNLPEDTPVGQSLLRVRASDADADYGVLVFSIEQDEGGYFRIDAKTGELFLNRPVDYETQSHHQVYLIQHRGQLC